MVGVGCPSQSSRRLSFPLDDESGVVSAVEEQSVRTRPAMMAWPRILSIFSVIPAAHSATFRQATGSHTHARSTRPCNARSECATQPKRGEAELLLRDGVVPGICSCGLQIEETFATRQKTAFLHPRAFWNLFGTGSADDRGRIRRRRRSVIGGPFPSRTAHLKSRHTGSSPRLSTLRS